MKNFIKQTQQMCHCGGIIVGEHSFSVKSAIPTSQIRYGGDNPTQKIIKSEFYCEACGLVYRSTPKNKIDDPSYDKLRSIFTEYRRIYLNNTVPVDQIVSEKHSVEAISKDETVFKFVGNSNRLVIPKQRIFPIFICFSPNKKPYLFDGDAEIRNLIEEQNKKGIGIIESLLKQGKFEEAEKETENYPYLQIWGPLKEIESIRVATKHSSIENIDLSKISIFEKLPAKESDLTDEIKNTIQKPKNAVEAIEVCIFDENWNCQEYWIPKKYIIEQD